MKASAENCSGPDLITKGRVIKVTEVKDEWYNDAGDPIKLLSCIKDKGVKTDLFTFIQKPPDLIPRYNFYIEYDNLAAIKITSYDDWWKNGISKQRRTNVRRASKNGVEIKIAEYNDDFVQGIKKIYDESPMRQGKPFWHFQKSFSELKKMHATYIDRADFIGGYIGNELIGFIKLVYSERTARTMHIISEVKHRDKSLNNAMLAKAVDLCCKKNMEYLIYGKMDYGKVGSKSLKTFKEENGFQQLDFIRYYVPFGLRGKILLYFNLHHGLIFFLPETMVRKLIDLRAKWYAFRHSNTLLN